MNKLYLLGSICGIILAIIFCYQHRPYIERTAVIGKVGFFDEGHKLHIDYLQEYDFCGEEMTITSTVKKITCEGYYFLGGCYKNNNKKGLFTEKSVEQPTTYIPCYKSKLKFR